MGREDDINFPNATIIKEEPVMKADSHERTVPQVSPDGKQMAFILDRNILAVMDLDSKKVRNLTDGSTYHHRNGVFNYVWSPDSKWIALEMIDRRHDPYTDIALLNVADGSLTNITNSGYFDEGPRWVMDGNALLFASERYGMRNHASWGSMMDVMIVFLNQEAYDKFKRNKEDAELAKEAEKAAKEKEEKAKKDDKKDDKKKDDKKKDEDKALKVEARRLGQTHGAPHPVLVRPQLHGHDRRRRDPFLHHHRRRQHALGNGPQRGQREHEQDPLARSEPVYDHARRQDDVYSGLDDKQVQPVQLQAHSRYHVGHAENRPCRRTRGHVRQHGARGGSTLLCEGYARRGLARHDQALPPLPAPYQQ